jgi:hypothetical protein
VQMKVPRTAAVCLTLLLALASVQAAGAAVVEIASVRELAEYAARSGNTVRMKPGVYRMSDYLTDDVIAAVRKEVPEEFRTRPPVWMIRFSGSDNRFELNDVVLEIDTGLYPKLPRGYTRCLFVPGSDNVIDGLTVRNTGPNQGSNGNTFSVWGIGNRVENVTLHVSGSKPYGYGDLLGKGGPNLVGLQKQSGFMVAGRDNTLRRCKVISRAFGHCFYIQKPAELAATDNIRLEDCYAEGVMRPTSDMLRETSGPLAELNFRTIAENRDGRFLVVAGYMKSLVEDGFRTYGGTGKITLVNCTAVNTRAGFEIAGPDSGTEKTLIDGGNALGCERAYLIGSNTVVRHSRGDTRYGPLLYLRGGRDSDVELELAGEGSDFTVHALATIAGEGHRVRLFTREREPRRAPSVPILLGFGMPANAEMASPIRPASTTGVRLVNELDRFAVVRSAEATDCTVETAGAVLTDEETRDLPGRPSSGPASRRTGDSRQTPQAGTR